MKTGAFISRPLLATLFLAGALVAAEQHGRVPPCEKCLGPRAHGREHPGFGRTPGREGKGG